MPRSRRLALGLGAVFLLSGAAGLVDQTAWTRLFESLFGHTVHTTAAVVAAFMGGLGLGAWLGGRLADRLIAPVRAYALLELGLGAMVWASPLLVRGAAGIGGTGPGAAARWLLAFALLLLPTTAMGATLPLLSRALAADADALAPVLAWLLGVNTLGAVAGVLGAGFWLIRVLGVTATVRVGAVLSLTAGLAALALSLAAGERVGAAAGSGPTSDARAARLTWVSLAVLGSGLVALAAEVVWMRLFALVLGSSILSFALVLAALLAAYALGSLAFPLLCRRRRLAALGWVQVGLGLAVAATVLAFRSLDRLVGLGGAGGLLAGGAGRALLVALVVALPGALMGAVLPAASAAVTDGSRVGRGVGALYLGNTVGNLVGALGAGYLLIPVLGGSRSLVGLGLLALAVGVAVLLGEGGARRPAVWLVAGAGALLLAGVWVGAAPGATRTVLGMSKTYARLTWVREGLRGTVTVFDVPPLPVLAARPDAAVLRPVAAGYRLLAVDGVDVAGSSPDLRTTQRMQAHVPLLLHGAPRRVLQVGYGSGETSREALRHPLELLQVVELNPDVVAEAARWFPGFQPAGFAAVFGDARIVIRESRERFDAVLNDSTYPGLAGSSQLYSADHFRACRALLRPGGVVSTWLPIDLPPETFRMVLASFISVFPEASFWLPANCWNKHGVLVGTLDPQGPLVERLRQGRWPEAVRSSLEELGYGDAEAFVSMRVLGAEEIRRLAAGAPVNDDEHPLLEYPTRGPRVSGEAFWAETLSLVVRSLGPPGRLANLSVAGPGERMGEAVRLVLAGQLALLDDDPEAAVTLYRQARLVAPGHPGPPQLLRDNLVFRAQAARDAGLVAEAQRLLGEAQRLGSVRR